MGGIFQAKGLKILGRGKSPPFEPTRSIVPNEANDLRLISTQKGLKIFREELNEGQFTSSI